MSKAVVIAVIGIVVLLLVAVPLLKQVCAAATAAALPPESRPPGGNRAPIPARKSTPSAADEEATIDLARVEGRVKASAVRKVSEIVEKHPEEALSIVRSWMHKED